jgi:hypothetical protein
MMVRIGSFGLLQFAQNDCARVPEPRNDSGIFLRAIVTIDRHAVRARYILYPAEILHRDRHTVKRTANLATCDLLLRGTRLFQRRCVRQVSITLERTIEPRDTVELGLGRFNRRQLTRLDKLPDLEQSQIVQIC